MTTRVFCVKIYDMALRVLLIGQGLFREGLVRLVAEQPEVQIVATAENWESAHPLIETTRPDALIVDHADAGLRQADLVQGLESRVPTIIYLTLADTQMVVHNWQHVADVQVADLVQALQASAKRSAVVADAPPTPARASKTSHRSTSSVRRSLRKTGKVV